MFALWNGSHKTLYRVHYVSSIWIKNKNTAFSLESRPCWVVWDHRVVLWETAKLGVKLWNTQADRSRLQWWQACILFVCSRWLCWIFLVCSCNFPFFIDLIMFSSKIERRRYFTEFVSVLWFSWILMILPLLASLIVLILSDNMQQTMEAVPSLSANAGCYSVRFWTAAILRQTVTFLWNQMSCKTLLVSELWFIDICVGESCRWDLGDT